MEIKHSFDSQNELLVLDFDDETKIEIDTKGDVDFTVLVKTLTLKLETKSKIIIGEGKYDDSKIHIIFNTIKSIVDSYNTVLFDNFDIS